MSFPSGMQMLSKSKVYNLLAKVPFKQFTLSGRQEINSADLGHFNTQMAFVIDYSGK
jgi:hypothetical protein